MAVHLLSPNRSFGGAVSLIQINRGGRGRMPSCSIAFAACGTPSPTGVPSKWAPSRSGSIRRKRHPLTGVPRGKRSKLRKGVAHAAYRRQNRPTRLRGALAPRVTCGVTFRARRAAVRSTSSALSASSTAHSRNCLTTGGAVEPVTKFRHLLARSRSAREFCMVLLLVVKNFRKARRRSVVRHSRTSFLVLVNNASSRTFQAEKPGAAEKPDAGWNIFLLSVVDSCAT
jgi:hypothetical protein